MPRPTHYVDRLGRVFLSEDERQLVRQLHRASRAGAPTDSKWMLQVSLRASLVDGAFIRYDTAENFIADLIDWGFISPAQLS